MKLFIALAVLGLCAGQNPTPTWPGYMSASVVSVLGANPPFKSVAKMWITSPPNFGPAYFRVDTFNPAPGIARASVFANPMANKSVSITTMTSGQTTCFPLPSFGMPSFSTLLSVFQYAGEETVRDKACHKFVYDVNSPGFSSHSEYFCNPLADGTCAPVMMSQLNTTAGVAMWANTTFEEVSTDPISADVYDFATLYPALKCGFSQVAVEAHERVRRIQHPLGFSLGLSNPVFPADAVFVVNAVVQGMPQPQVTSMFLSGSTGQSRVDIFAPNSEARTISIVDPPSSYFVSVSADNNATSCFRSTAGASPAMPTFEQFTFSGAEVMRGINCNLWVFDSKNGTESSHLEYYENAENRSPVRYVMSNSTSMGNVQVTADFFDVTVGPVKPIYFDVNSLWPGACNSSAEITTVVRSSRRSNAHTSFAFAKLD